jgi:hypothetical protein
VSGEITLTIDGGVGTVLLNRPEKRNALSRSLIAALKATLLRADADDAVRVIAVRGAGKDFCSGMDLAELGVKRALVLTAYRRDLVALGEALSQSITRASVSDELLARIEFYRERLPAAVAERLGGVLKTGGVFSREKADEMLAEGWVCDLAGSERLLPRATPLAEGTAETARWYRTQGWI